MQINEYFERNRPRVLSEVVGNKGPKRGLQSLIRQGVAPKGTLFHGPAGHGKTTLARIGARRIVCTGASPSEPDPCGQCQNCRTGNCKVFELNAATLTIAHLKDIQRDSMYVYEEPRVYFVDELHRATDRIQDVLVTMLEEGRANYCFIFCTLHVERIEEPLLQRLISFKVTPPTTEEMVQRLKLICVREGWSHPDTRLTEIAEANHNVPRACENALFLESLT